MSVIGRALGAFSLGFLAQLALFFGIGSLASAPNTPAEAAMAVVFYSFIALVLTALPPRHAANGRPWWYGWFLLALGACIAITDCYVLYRGFVATEASLGRAAAANLFTQGSVLLMVLSICFMGGGVLGALWSGSGARPHN